MGRTMQWNSLVVCIINFFAIVGMANVQYRAVECVSLQVSPTIGGLIDAFLGKSVEQVMAIQCLRAGLTQVLKANLMGSMHWCLLLVLGMSIFAAGHVFWVATGLVSRASFEKLWQVVAAISITLPTMFCSVPGVSAEHVVLLSRVCAAFLIFLYFSFIYFHLKTHKASFQTAEAQHIMSEEERELSGLDAIVICQLSLGSSILLMVASIAVAAFNSQVLVDHLQDLSQTFHVPQQFIGATMLPILGNTAEHIASVSYAMKDEMDSAISVAVGSATQIALFVVPLSVFSGWALDTPMSLDFSMPLVLKIRELRYDSAVMLLGTFLVAQMLRHGSSNWLHGAARTRLSGGVSPSRRAKRGVPQTGGGAQPVSL
ncbi:unnamed protein product [Effrenium voratum]|nr:unnamed protein product [Effrenium voratum]